MVCNVNTIFPLSSLFAHFEITLIRSDASNDNNNNNQEERIQNVKPRLSFVCNFAKSQQTKMLKHTLVLIKSNLHITYLII